MFLILSIKSSFPINLENFFSEIASILCGGPQRSILGPVLSLIYIIHDLFLCADAICLVFQSKHFRDNKKQLNKDFANI